MHDDDDGKYMSHINVCNAIKNKILLKPIRKMTIFSLLLRILFVSVMTFVNVAFL